MTDLLDVLPSFPTTQYTHLLPSLERNSITISDLLTLDGIEVTKRAQLPLLDVKRLIAHVLAHLQAEIGVESAQHAENRARRFDYVSAKGQQGWGKLTTGGRNLLNKPWNSVSLGDEKLDQVLGGGIPTGYITEFVGESGAAKTQLLLILLLTAQLPAPHGLDRPTLYISTEHALPTPRLAQLIRSHPIFASLSVSSRPSLSKILSISTPDLESQDHIVRYQVPVALQRHNIGLVVIDSVAANYRAEKSFSPTATTGRGSRAEALADRGAQLVQLGEALRKLAREHDCAIVVANQVSDRFSPLPSSSANAGKATPAMQRSAGPWSSSPATASQQGLGEYDGGAPRPPEVLSLDHQMRWFSGWGDDPTRISVGQGDKVPALGLAWANQIACRVALTKEESFACKDENASMNREGEAAEWTPRRWKRHMRLVYAPWAASTAESEKGVKFEVWEGGARAM